MSAPDGPSDLAQRREAERWFLHADGDLREPDIETVRGGLGALHAARAALGILPPEDGPEGP